MRREENRVFLLLLSSFFMLTNGFRDKIHRSRLDSYLLIVGYFMRHPLRFAHIAFAGIALLWSYAFAATSDDYYKAAMTLYNAKNYDQAVKYFNAALQVDPNNAAALQGRANCFYTQGNTSAALADYQKVLAQNPSNPQLAQFVQALQTKVGSTPPAAPGPAPGDPYAQGVAFYGQKQYQAAIPDFQEASRLNPSDAKPYYYLGLCDMWVGDARGGALNLSLSNRKQPNPSVEAYVNQVMGQLSPADQQWVTDQLAGSAPGTTPSLAASPGSKAWQQHPFGVRLMPSFVLNNMTALNNEAQFAKSWAANQQNIDPTVGFNAEVPSGYTNLTVEPFYKLGPDFEVGLPIWYGIIGQFSEAVTSGSGTYSYGTTFNFSAFSVGLEGRYYFGSAPLRFFIAGGPMVIPMSLSSPSSAGTTAINPSAIGLGAQVHLGVDYQLGDTMSIGPFLGYQYADISGFTATVDGQNVELYLNPNSNGWSTFFPGTSGNTLSGSTPFDVDLSGLFFGLQFSAVF